MIRSIFLYAALLAVLATAGHAVSIKSEAEVGHILAMGLYEDGVTRNRPYFYYKGRYDQPTCPTDTDRIWYEAAGRLWADAAQGRGKFEIRDLTISYTGELVTIRAGFQEIAWGETFGFYIADLVNPRDLTDPIFNEIGFIRKPVCTLNTKFITDSLTIQTIVTPLPRNNDLPRKSESFDVLPAILAPVPVLQTDGYQIGTGAEYGGRMTYLFKSGWELSAFYLRHWNRNVVYALQFPGGNAVLKPITKRIHSVGIGFTKGYESTVFRGDIVAHKNTPWTGNSFGTVVRNNVWRAIIGADRTYPKNIVIGAQYHLDLWHRGSLHYVSFNVVKKIEKPNLELACFLFQGININDRWIQPQITWTGPKGWEVAFRADLLWGGTKHGTVKDGLLGPVRHKDRLLLWVSRMM